MAHAAPVSGVRRSELTAGRTRAPDLFSERTHRAAAWATPVVLGLVYGYWAAANRRGGGAITGWNILFGFVTAAVFAVLYIVVRDLAPRMRRELHALSWAVFTGVAFGFLYSQTGYSVLRSCAVAAVIGAGVGVCQFYRYYSREDAEGHRIH
ncbi:hypothetical protein [Streptomyces griseus]|uniref:hypothetical protein n=1 Tax=Streptomyces griseus TaxID=1911 RepID=UPI000561A106|nr:hypothetical protein [Streptomyces griseus]